MITWVYGFLGACLMVVCKKGGSRACFQGEAFMTLMKKIFEGLSIIVIGNGAFDSQSIDNARERFS